MNEVQLLQDFAVALVVASIFGWVFRKCRLSAVVGYLLAGVVIGPHTPPFALITDLDRVHTLSQLGLVFLMFYVGLGLHLQRIRNLGVSLLLTAGLGALLVFLGSRALALVLGLTSLQATFLAAALMVSSSAILTRMLAEKGLTHQKVGQRALGITVLEDVVAILLLALLTARLQWEVAAADTSMLKTVWLLGGFVVFSVVVGLLFLPKILRRLVAGANSDLMMVLVAGLLFLAAWLAVRMGYSVALGAFLFGVIVSETPVKARMEKAFIGAQEMFSALFFVSVGMLIDLRMLSTQWPLVLGFTAFAIFIRGFACGTAQLATGASARQALQGACVLLPVGEFSYIIVQLAVTGGVFPESIYGVAVSVSIFTAILAPLLLRGVEKAGEKVDRYQPAWLGRWFEIMNVWQERVRQKRKRNLFWKVMKPRIGQLVFELMLLAGLLGFSGAGYHFIGDFFAKAGWDWPAWRLVYGAVMSLAIIGLALMIWRNLGALSMIYSEAIVGTAEDRIRLRTVLEGGLQALSAVVLGGLIYILAPVELESLWTNVIVVGGIVLCGVFFWRRLIWWHSHFRINFQAALNNTHGGAKLLRPQRTTRYIEGWGVELGEFEVPDQGWCVGKSLAALDLRKNHGCAVVEIERQGTTITNPTPEQCLYSGDKLLLFGTEEQIEGARAYMQTRPYVEVTSDGFDETGLETITVPETFTRKHLSLAELRMFSCTGVQLLGLERQDVRQLIPPADTRLEVGDRLLVLCTPRELLVLVDWLCQ
jgi:monovalent cation:H+ antiporter-2, CPA2 family